MHLQTVQLGTADAGMQRSGRSPPTERSDINRSELLQLKCRSLTGSFGFVLTWVGLCTRGESQGAGGGRVSGRRSRRRGAGQKRKLIGSLWLDKREREGEKERERETAYGLAA